MTALAGTLTMERMNRSWSVLLVLCLLACGQEDGVRTIHVPDDVGSIQGAVNMARTGDIVLVESGIYRENVRIEGKSITLASRFYSSGDEQHVVQTVIDGSGGTTIDVGSAATGSRIAGLTIRNGKDGLLVASDVEIYGNHIIANEDGIDYESGGGVCARNRIADNQDDGIDLDGPVAVTISDNIIQDNGDDGIEVRFHPYSGPMLRIYVSRNVISRNLEDGLQLIGYPGVSSRVVRVERNVFRENAMVGIGFMADGNTIEDQAGAPVPEPVRIINNTFTGNPYAVTGGANVVVLNNIFSGSSGSALRNVTAESHIRHNLFWNNAVDQENSNVDVATSLFADPLLDVDQRLSQGSPAIDAGISFFELNGEVVLDLEDASFSGSVPDLGTYEYIP